MAYYVQIQDRGNGTYRRTNTSFIGLWDIKESFHSVENAVEGITEWKQKMACFSPKFRVIDSSGNVWWPDATNPAERGAPSVMGDNPIQLEKPLVLTKSKVLDKIKSNLKKEQDTREEAEQKEKDARSDFRQFLMDHEEQVVNYVRACISGGNSWKSALEQADEVFEKDGQYKNVESKKTRLETELEKFARVLEMSAEDTIEVKSTQAVYDLL